MAKANSKPSWLGRPLITGILAVLTVILAILLIMVWDSNRVLNEELSIANSAAKVYSAQGSLASQPTPTPTPSGDPKLLPPVSSADHLLGSSKAKVIMVEYSDYECPFCKAFHPTLQQVQKDYGDQVAWVLRPYPLSFHANAEKEAEAAECVASIGGNADFWKYSDLIFSRTTSNGTGFSLDQLAPTAAEVGVDQTAFTNCLNSGKYSKQIQASESSGAKAGVLGTPGTFLVKVGSSQLPELVPGEISIDQLKQKIDSLLNS